MIDIWSNVHVLWAKLDYGSRDYMQVLLLVPTANEAQRESLKQLYGQTVTISISTGSSEEQSSQGARIQAGEEQNQI